jgi:hypothetical protein
MSTGWHLDADLLEDYALGAPLSPARAASVEKHLEACADCRAGIAPLADASRLDAVWAEVVDTVDAPAPLWVERLLTRLGVSGPTARLIGLTPSLRVPWLAGMAVALLLALAAAHTGETGVALFLALAPVLPVAGVALAFGPRTEPMHEVALATAYSSFRLLLARSAAVVASTLLVAVPVAALLPGSPWLAVGWLLPALALVTASLALAGRVEPAVSAAALGAAWLLVSLSALLPDVDPLLVTRLGVQALCLVLLAVAGLALLRQARQPFVLGSPA